MNWRLGAVAFGCIGVLAGAAVAAHQFAGETAEPAPPPPPLFVQAATDVPLYATWPQQRPPVAYGDEMHALLTMAAAPKVASHATADDDVVEPPRQRKSRRAERRARERDTIEVHVLDQHGNRIRVGRVQRERIERGAPGYRARAYAPPSPFGLFGLFR